MRISRLSAFALAAIVAAACAETAEDEAVPADSVAVATDSARAQELPTEPTVTKLDDVNDSGIEGEATATHSQQEVTVSILLKGDKAKADQSYPAHIHTGTCKEGGPVAVELGTVQNLQSSKTVSLSSLPSGKPAFVQVHGQDGKPVACGDMEGHEGDDRMGRDTVRTTTTY
jgi:hypothetical protein